MAKDIRYQKNAENQRKPVSTGRCCGHQPTITRRWGRVVVMASFLTFLLHNGVLGTFGIFLPIFLNEFEQGSGQLGWVLSSGIAVECFAGPVGNFIVRRIGCRRAVMLGGVLLACGTATASFATSVCHMFVCLGLVAGLGGSIIHVAVVVVIGEYYNRHYTVANGIAYAGPGAGVVVFPPLIQYLNEMFDWKQCLIIEAAIVSNVVVLGFLFRPASKYKSRLRRLRPLVSDTVSKQLDYLPLPAIQEDGKDNSEDAPDSGISEVCTETKVLRTNSTTKPNIDGENSKSSSCFYKGSFRSRRCMTFTPASLAVFAACVFHTAGYSGVSVHLVNKAVSSGMSPREASILLSCIGIGSLVGRLTHGWFLTRKYITASWMYTFALLVSVVVTATVPQITNFGGQIACAVAVGICSGVYFSLVAVLLRELVGLLYLGMAFGVSLFCSGIGTTIGGCVIGVLRDVTGSYCAPSYLISVFFALAAISSLPRPVIQWYRARCCRLMGPIASPTPVRDGAL